MIADRTIPPIERKNFAGSHIVNFWMPVDIWNLYLDVQWKFECFGFTAEDGKERFQNLKAAGH